jgi:hypothetical protein
MPKLLRINNFARSGLNSDIPPWDLPGDFLTEIRNVRLITGGIRPFGGSSLWATLPVDFQPGFLMSTGSTSGVFWIIAGRDKILAYDGETFFDISSGVYPVLNEDLWYGCLLSTIAIINNEGHFPEYWPQQSGSTDLLALPWDATNTWSDVGENAKIIRSHKQFLFALNLQSGGDEIPDGVRWSAPADIGGIPNTWDPLDNTDVAGITNLGGDGGEIIDGRSLRDAFVVYRESSISIFDYVGGQFVWQIRHLSDTNGLVSPDALLEVKGVHYFIGDGDILFNDGNTIRSLLHNKIRRRFIANFDSDNFRNSYAVKNNIASEAWFCIPEAGEVYPNIAYVYNWEGDTWSIRDIPRAPFANYGQQSSIPITWENIQGTWDTVFGTWSQTKLTPLDETIIAVTKPAGAGQSGELLRLDKSIGEILSPFASVIERTGFALEGLDVVTTITRIYPHMRGPGSVNIRVGSQDFPGAPIRWKASTKFNPDEDRKVDIRTTGELHCFRISTEDDSAATWELSGLDIEYVVSGAR